MIYSTSGQHPGLNESPKGNWNLPAGNVCLLIYSSICMQLGSNFNFILMVIFTDIVRWLAGLFVDLLFYLLPFYKRFQLRAQTQTLHILGKNFQKYFYQTRR